MNGSFAKWRYRLMALILPAAMLSLGYAPARAGLRADSVGDGDLTDEFHGVRDPSSGEGDPLDTNDFGGGGDPGLRHYQAADGYSSWLLLSRTMLGKQIVIVPASHGGLITFRLLVIEIPVDAAED